jgi:hypothetical protein
MTRQNCVEFKSVSVIEVLLEPTDVHWPKYCLWLPSLT